MAASLKDIPGSLRQALAKPQSPLCCHAPGPLSVCFAYHSIPPPSLLSLCLSIIVPLFYFQPSALFLKKNSWAAGVTEEIFF